MSPGELESGARINIRARLHPADAHSLELLPCCLHVPAQPLAVVSLASPAPAGPSEDRVSLLGRILFQLRTPQPPRRSSTVSFDATPYLHKENHSHQIRVTSDSANALPQPTQMVPPHFSYRSTRRMHQRSVYNDEMKLISWPLLAPPCGRYHHHPQPPLLHVIPAAPARTGHTGCSSPSSSSSSPS